MSDRFPCKDYLAQVNLSPAPLMPVLWGTFGFDLTCIASFIESNHDRPHAVEIHFSNERCRFHERCAEGELLGQLGTKEYNDALEAETGWVLEAIKDRAEALGKVLEALKGPLTTIFITTGLEDLYTDRAFGIIYNELAKVLPYEIVRSPVDHMSRPHSLELHGLQSPCTETTFASNDGDAVSLQGARLYRELHRDCKATILWTCDLQGACGDFIKPADRTFEFNPGNVAIWEAFLED